MEGWWGGGGGEGHIYIHCNNTKSNVTGSFVLASSQVHPPSHTSLIEEFNTSSWCCGGKKYFHEIKAYYILFVGINIIMDILNNAQ